MHAGKNLLLNIALLYLIATLIALWEYIYSLYKCLKTMSNFSQRVEQTQSPVIKIPRFCLEKGFFNNIILDNQLY